MWVIELENQGYAQSFGTPSADPYLATTLPRTGPAGELLRHRPQQRGQLHRAGLRAGPGHRHPDRLPLWTPFPGQVIAGPYRQFLGEGCVYPAAVQTLGNQLSAAGRSWAAYLQDMGNDPARDHTVATARGPACGHPATWAIDHTQKAGKGDQYAARHDGFTFFRSVTASQAFCAAHILSFRPLPGDLARAAACCGETSGISPSHPNVPLPGKTGPGGGRIGAVLLSPLIRPGTVSAIPYNHYSLLRSIEDIFGLPHLGDAAMPQARSFGPDVFG